MNVHDPAYETIKRENKLQKLLRTLKSNGEIDNNVYKRVFPSGSRAGIMYTTLKIHKDRMPSRPIISQIGTYTYQLANLVELVVEVFVSMAESVVAAVCFFV
jgi:hypothetical protein